MKIILTILISLLFTNVSAQKGFVATGFGTAATVAISVGAYKYSQTPPKEYTFKGNKAGYQNAIFAHQKSTRVLYAFAGLAGGFTIIQGSIELSKVVKNKKTRFELTANSLHLYYNF